MEDTRGRGGVRPAHARDGSGCRTRPTKESEQIDATGLHRHPTAGCEVFLCARRRAGERKGVRRPVYRRRRVPAATYRRPSEWERVVGTQGAADYREERSEERRVGKECRCGWEA